MVKQSDKNQISKSEFNYFDIHVLNVNGSLTIGENHDTSLILASVQQLLSIIMMHYLLAATFNLSYAQIVNIRLNESISVEDVMFNPFISAETFTKFDPTGNILIV